MADDWLQARAAAGVQAVEGNPKGPALSRSVKNAPARALQALKWMNKNASQEMDLSNLQVPVTPRATLIKALEDRIVGLHSVGDERWTVLLASWMMAFGCLRYTHIIRSEPRRLTAAFLHSRCQKGKQKHNSLFLWWALLGEGGPRSPPDTCPSQQRVSGLCFSDEGRPWTILEVQESMQNEMAVLLHNPEEVTTYSWRRMAPTLAELLESRPEEPLSDWQNKGD